MTRDDYEAHLKRHGYEAAMERTKPVSPSPSTARPLAALVPAARDHVSLGEDVTVTKFDRGPNAFQVGIAQTDEPDAGTVTLVLGDKPLELQQWTIVDSKGQEVRVGLYNAEFGVELENKLFRTPEKKKKGS